METKYILPGVFTIPEGYEAKIEDGKVIVRKKETAFESVRKELLAAVEKGRVFDIDQSVADRWVTFLEGLESIGESSAKNCAISFIEFLDKNSYEGKMCVSNPECEDIVNAFVEKDWAKLVAYGNMYLRGAAEGRTVPLSSKRQEWINAVENVAGAFPPGSKGYDMVIGSIHDLIKYLKSTCLENRMWSEEDEKQLNWFYRLLDFIGKEFPSTWGQNHKGGKEWLKSIRPHHTIRWRRATEGANIPESIIIPDGEEPRFGKCAVKNSYYIPVEELKNLPKDES